MNKETKYPLFSLFVDNKDVDESSDIKYQILDIIYKKSFCNLEQLIINDSNFKDMINNHSKTFEINDIAFNYYKKQEQIVIYKFIESLTYKEFTDNLSKDVFGLDEIFEKLCLKALDNPLKNFVLVLENYQLEDSNDILEDVQHLFNLNRCFKPKSKYEECNLGIPNNVYILGIINKFKK